MRLGIFVAACNATSQPTRFLVNSPEHGIMSIASGDREYVGTAFLFYGADEVIQHHGDAYFNNFNALAYLYDAVAGTPDNENLDKNFKVLESIASAIYSKHKSPVTFRESGSTPFKNDYSSRVFNYIYGERLLPDLLRLPNVHAIFLRKLLQFYSSFSQKLVQDKKISKHAGMFPFHEMATDLFKGLLFMSKMKPDEINPLVGRILECLVAFHYFSSRLYGSITLEKNRHVPVSEFQKEYFDDLCTQTDKFVLLYDDFNRIMYTNPGLFSKTEEVLIHTVNRFRALISMMYMLSCMGYTVDSSGFLVIDCQFLEFLSKSIVHVTLSSLKTDICMKYALQDIKVPLNKRLSEIFNSVARLLLKSYHFVNRNTVENRLGFNSQDGPELTDIPRDVLDKLCSRIMLMLSQDLFRSVFSNNIKIQLGSKHNLLIELFAVMHDLILQDVIPFNEFIQSVQLGKLRSLDFENTGTFAGMVDSALNKLISMVPHAKMHDVKTYLELHSMLDSIVRFSGAGSVSVDNVSLYQTLIDALEKVNEKKILENCKYKILLYSATVGFVTSTCLFALLVFKTKQKGACGTPAINKSLQ